MNVLLPRARLNLFAPEWQFLNLSQQKKQDLQQQLDESPFEKTLCARGITTHSVVSTDIVPVAGIEASQKQLGDRTFDCIMLVSKNAALLASLLMPPHIFEKSQCFAVGKACLNFFPDTVFQTGESEGYPESAKGLMQLQALQDIKGKNILIVKGEQGLDDLEYFCAERGAKTLVLNMYKRQSASNIDWSHIGKEIATLDAVYGISVFALEHLVSNLSGEKKENILCKPLLAMSQRIANAADEIGFKSIEVDKL